MRSSRPDAIPQPPRDPLIGNVRSIDPAAPMQSFMRLARQYGPIFRLSLPSQEMVIVSSQSIVDEVCDEGRFHKRVHAVLEHIRGFAGDGLFTAHNDEPSWGIAHRVLMPSFGPIGLRAITPPPTVYGSTIAVCVR